MRKRWKLLVLATCALLVAGALGRRLARDQEPSSQGLTLSQWYVIWANSVEKEDQLSKAQTAQAADAIRQIGSNAVPVLLKHLQQDTSPVRQLFLHIATGILPSPIIQSRAFDSLFSHANQVEPTSTFVILGPRAAQAVPELAKFLHAKNNRTLVHCAVYCLGAVGEAGVPPLLSALSDPKAPACYETVNLLSMQVHYIWGTNIAQAVPLLASYAVGTNQELAEPATVALGRIHYEPTIAIPALTQCLQSKNERVRVAAMRSLLRLGHQNAPILISNPDESVRRAATNYLKMVAPELLTNAPAH